MIGKDFVTGGHAIFTVSNGSGEHFTYRVTAPQDFNEMYPIWFVSCLVGPDNTSDYAYLGILRDDGSVRTTAKSKFQADGKQVKVVQWAMKIIWDDGKGLPEGYKIQHMGKCGKCGRPLTTPESLESGIGPVCSGRG